MRNPLLWIASLLIASCTSDPPIVGAHPDLILYGGVIYTQEGGEVVEAVALQDGRVLAVGTDRRIRALATGNTQEIDLDGKAAYPGFADAHAHLGGIGSAAQRLDLVGTESFEAVLELVKARDAELPKGEWLTGRGWDQNDWPVQEFPHHAALSAAVPNRPVLLTRVDGHALLANAAAMRAAGVDRTTPDPNGGRLLRDADGSLTGVFVDAAEGLIHRVVPAGDAGSARAAVLAATAEVHSQGITALHDAGVGQGMLDVLSRMEGEGALKLRLHEMLDGSDGPLLESHFASGPVDGSKGAGVLGIRSIKLYADGALGSRGAALLEEYSDDHGNHGLTITTPEDMHRVCDGALAKGFQVCTHAIGDRGVRGTLNSYAAAFERADQDPKEARFRVEHAQVVHLDDFKVFGDLGVIPSMQPQHLTSDMPWAQDRVGPDRILGAYAWRRFIDAGCIIPGGSDAPVERLDIVALFTAAATRKDVEGHPKAGWYADQALSREEALNMLTTWPAWAAFREHDLGKLAPGYRADVVVFDGDLMTATDGELANCFPVMTVFAGDVVWEKGE